MVDWEVGECIEQSALLGWHAAVSPTDLPGYDWRLEKVGDAMCSVSASEPSFVINRVLGLGSQGTPTIDQLTAIRELYREAGVPRFFLHVLPDRLGRNTPRFSPPRQPERTPQSTDSCSASGRLHIHRYHDG